MGRDDLEFKALMHYWDPNAHQVAVCLDRMHNSAKRRIRRCFEPGLGALSITQWLHFLPNTAWNDNYARTTFIDEETTHSFHRYKVYQGWRPNEPCCDVIAEAWLPEGADCPPPEVGELPLLDNPTPEEMNWVGFVLDPWRNLPVALGGGPTKRYDKQRTPEHLEAIV